MAARAVGPLGRAALSGIAALVAAAALGPVSSRAAPGVPSGSAPSVEAPSAGTAPGAHTDAMPAPGPPRAPVPAAVGWGRGPRPLLLTLEVAAGSRFGADPSATTSDTPAGGALFASALWREVPFVAVGLELGLGGLPSRAADTDAVLLTSALLQLRGILPLGRWDLWLELGLGFGSLTQTVRFANARRITQIGPALGAGVGADFRVRPWLSVGLGWRILRVFPALQCADGDCAGSDEGVDPGLLWWLGLRVTFHVGCAGGPRR